jgi:hypothetical protein
MNAVRFFVVASITSSLLVLACAADEGVTKTDEPKNARAPTGPHHLDDDGFDPSCCTKRELDLNRDGKSDAYVFLIVVDGVARIVRKENDLNDDRKIDIVRTMNERGELVQERLDTDFDGRIDLVVIFERGKIVRKENDTNFDSRVDVWRYFEKDAISRKEADLNYDGRVDYWEYFEGGTLDRVGIDRDGDGNVDEWLTGAQETG